MHHNVCRDVYRLHWKGDLWRLVCDGRLLQLSRPTAEIGGAMQGVTVLGAGQVHHWDCSRATAPGDAHLRLLPAQGCTRVTRQRRPQPAMGISCILIFWASQRPSRRHIANLVPHPARLGGMRWAPPCSCDKAVPAMKVWGTPNTSIRQWGISCGKSASKVLLSWRRAWFWGTRILRDGFLWI